MAEKKSDHEEPTQPSFEEALARLEQIVGRLEEGEVGLDAALEAYEQGVKLLRQCYDMLAKAQRKIELLSGVDAEGNPLTTPLDDESLSLEEKVERRTRRRRGGDSPADSPDEIDMDAPGGLL